ncbi:MAG: Mor transcription activator family protein [Sulfurimicrobium sp.]|nr:Mor transcription activator family protein [Sulfurimicrobium sp.]
MQKSAGLPIFSPRLSMTEPEQTSGSLSAFSVVRHEEIIPPYGSQSAGRIWGAMLLMACAENYTGIFRDVVLCIGEECAEKLIAKYGGTRLYIPATLGTGHDLCLLLGGDAAQRLIDGFKGEVLEIPRGWLTHIQQRNALMMNDRESGMPQRALAIKYRLTERTVRKIVSGINAAHQGHKRQE